MKVLYAVLLCLCTLVQPCISQDLVFPPELIWWLFEVKKVNTDINIDDFYKDHERSIAYLESKKTPSPKYPVFQKWNYYGDRFAYYDILDNLSRMVNGKYYISSDIDSAFAVFSRNLELLFIDYFGPSEGINGFQWINDNEIVTVGLEISEDDNNNSIVSLVIRVYKLEKDEVKVLVYYYRNAFPNEEREKLLLNWWEQRSDYFEHP